MELLERIVREDGCVGLVGDLQDKGIAPADRTSRWRDELAVDDARFELGPFALIYAMTEGRIDDDGQSDVAVLGEESSHRLVELCEARGGAALGGDVGSVDDDVRDGHVAK